LLTLRLKVTVSPTAAVSLSTDFVMAIWGAEGAGVAVTVAVGVAASVTVGVAVATGVSHPFAAGC
jgi:hypothetical protein